MTGPDPTALARRVVDGMMANDAFSQWLGVEVLDVAPARATIQMTVRPEMCNGFGVCHGGVTFAFADSAFAFACNTHGTVTVSIETGISYPAPIRAGDRLIATATEETRSNRILYYRVLVTREDTGALVGLFRGTAYRTDRPHFPSTATP